MEEVEKGSGADDLNLPTATVDALGHATGTTYDADLNKASMVDGLGHATGMTYDGRDRLVSQTDPAGGGTTSYTYTYAFLHSLGRTQLRYPFRLYGYCLMSNHFHLLLRPEPGTTISRVLQSLTVAITMLPARSSNPFWSQSFIRSSTRVLVRSPARRTDHGPRATAL